MGSKSGAKGKLIGVAVIGALLYGGLQIIKPDFDGLPGPQPDKKPQLSPGAQVRKVRVQFAWYPSPRRTAVEFGIFAGTVHVLSDKNVTSPEIAEFDVQAGTVVKAVAFQSEKGLLECDVFSNGKLIADDILDTKAGQVECTAVVP